MNIELFEAARLGDCEGISRWLGQGADINFKNPACNEATVLFAAVAGGHEAAVALLIERGADVNAINRDGWRPLHLASEKLSIGAISRLFSAGATYDESCEDIMRQQPASSENKEQALILLRLASYLDSVHLMYLLPVIYSYAYEEKIQKIINGLLLAYVALDDLQIQNYLVDAYNLDVTFHRQAPELLRHIVRRCALPNDLLENVIADIGNDKLRENVESLNTFAQIVKYSVNHGASVRLPQLINIIDSVEHDSVKRELASAIAIILNREGLNVLRHEDKQRLLPLLLRLDHPAQFLFESTISETHIGPIVSKKPITVKVKSSVKPAVSVSRQLQASKTSYKAKAQEEEKVAVLSLMEKLKDKHKNGQSNTDRSTLPSPKTSGGSDCYWTRTTYGEALHHYAKAAAGKVLNEDDIDNYLPGHFLSGRNRCWSGGIPANFFVDRMLCSTLSLASNGQQLNQETFNKLLLCIGPASHFKQLLFDTSVSSVIARSMIDPSILDEKYTDAPDFVARAAKQLNDDVIVKIEVEKGWLWDTKHKRYRHDESKVMLVVEAELDAMRVEAMIAIYHCVSRKPSMLNRDAVKTIERCLHSSNKQLKKYAIKTLWLLGDVAGLDYKLLFNSCLDRLCETTNQDEAIEEAISYISRQIQDTKKASEFLDDDVIKRILGCVHGSRLSLQNKLDCFDIVDDYVRLSSVKGLSITHLNKLFEIIHDPGSDQMMLHAIFNILVIHSNKTKTLPKEKLSELLCKIEKFDPTSQNLLVLSLMNLDVKSELDVNLIAFKLLDYSVPIYDINEVKFVSRTQDNRDSPSVDMMVSTIIAEASQSKDAAKFTQDTLEYLVKGLSSGNKQTRISCAKALYYANKNDLIEGMIGLDLLFEVQSFTDDPVGDISVYATCFYVLALQLHSSSKYLLPATHLNFLSQIYVNNRLALGDNDYGTLVNQGILNIIQQEVYKKNKLDDSVFDIFLSLYSTENGVGNDEFKQWLEIISQHVTKNRYPIPSAIISILENALADTELSTQVLDVLMAAIKNRQVVGEKTLQTLKNILLQSDNEALRQSALDCLTIANIHQDLPDSVYTLLEIEKVVDVIARDLPSKTQAWKLLNTLTKTVDKLPLSAFEMLVDSADFNQCGLELFCRFVQSGQALPSAVVEKLAEKFSHFNADKQFLRLFYCLVSHNQMLPSRLVQGLEKTLEDPKLVQDALKIFFQIGQRGSVLSDGVLSKILSTGQETFALDQDTMQASVDFACTLLQEERAYDHVREIELLFVKGLKTAQPYLVKACLNGFTFLKTRKMLSDNAIKALVSCLTEINDRETSLKIAEILGNLLVNKEVNSFVLLLNLDCISDEEYLERCFPLVQHTRLLDNNLTRISNIILLRPDLQYQALALIYQGADMKSLPLDLLKNIRILASGSADLAIKRIAQTILSKIDLTSIFPEEEKCVDGAFRITPFLSSLKTEPLSVEMMRHFKMHLRSFTEKQLTLSFATIYERLDETELDEALAFSLLQCVILAVNHDCDPRILEDILAVFIQSDVSRLRDLSFEGFKRLKAAGYESSRFVEVCRRITDVIQESTGERIKDVAVLHAAISVDVLSLPEEIEKTERVKALLSSDWSEKWKLNDADRIQLYQACSSHSNDILILLHRIDSLSFSQLMLTLNYLTFLTEDRAKEILCFEEEPFKVLRKEWLKAMLGKKNVDTSLDATFVDSLLDTMVSVCSDGVAEKLLTVIDAKDSLLELNALVGLCETHDIAEYQINTSLSLSQFQHVLGVKVLSSYFQLDLKGKRDEILSGLLSKGWPKAQLLDLVKTGLDGDAHRHREKYLLDVLHLVNEYDFSSVNYLKIKNILRSNDPSTWLKLINLEVVAQNFTQTPLMKNTDQMLESFVKDNTENKLVPELIASGLAADMAFICSKQAYASAFIYEDFNVDGEIERIRFKFDQPISEWNREQILLWANAVKSSLDYFLNPAHFREVIAVLKRANYLLTDFQLTNTQILACLVAFKSKKALGRLLQVQTGEGKTVIISMIAIIKALQGKKVDVVTNSPVEAERCAREQKPLYGCFGISVADNLDRSTYVKGEKHCYKNTVVYGEISQFQFDWLRDKYGLLKTKAGRACEEMVGDEVDSLVIDDSTKIAKLSSPIAGIDRLQPAYHFLHWHLHDMMARLFEINGKMYLFYSNVERQGDNLSITYIDKEGSLRKIDDLKKYVSTHKDISHIGQPILEDIGTFTEKEMKRYYDAMCAAGNIKVPINFQTFVEKQLPKWITNAMAANCEFEEKAQYLARDGRIKPVAFDSNGTVQESTHWGDGLHQFLQLKHGVALTSESMTTNFISNMGYVKLYGSNVCGLTGTLGPAVARDNLSRIYDVECVEVPSARDKQYKPMPTKLADTRLEWMSEVCAETLYETAKARGVLIICKTIEDVLALEEYIKSKSCATKIKTYTMDGCNQEKSIEHILPGEVVIATSLAGRGFDIKADAINKHGGMHVIMTYLADDRNDKQAIYRTSRQGRLGSGRHIFNKQVLLAEGYSFDDLKDIEAASARRETEEMERLFGDTLSRVEAKDRLFDKFCKFVSEIRREIRGKRQGVLKDVVNGVKSVFVDVAPSVLEMSTVAAIEEMWAMFLKRFDDKEIALSDMDAKYEQLEQDIRKRIKDGTVIQNPCHHIAIANDLMLNATLLSDDVSKAREHFEAAIRQDESASAAAFIGKAWIYLKTRKSDHREKTYKQLAIASFEKAKELLCEEMATLEGLLGLLQQHHVDPSADITRQLSIKMTLIGSHIRSVEGSIDAIKRSQRLITLVEKQESRRGGAVQTKTTREIERQPDGKISSLLADTATYSVQFNHLTVREDMGSVDQATKTIDNAFSWQEKELERLGNRYANIRLVVSNADLAGMQDFFNPHIEYSKLSKLDALAKLKSKHSTLSKVTLGYGDSSAVKVLVISKDDTVHSESTMTISEAISLVESIQEDHQVSLSFLNENPTLTSVSAVYKQQSPQAALDHLREMKYKSANITIFGNREILMQIMQEISGITHFFITEDNKNVTVEKHYSRDNGIEALRSAKDASVSIKLSGIEQSTLEAIASRYQTLLSEALPVTHEELTVDLTVEGIKVSESLSALKEGRADLHFSGLSSDLSKSLITRLRENTSEFITCFDSLTKACAERLICKAELTQEEMKISSVKSIYDLFAGQKIPESELAEMASRGLAFTLEVNERSFIPWWSVATVAILGSVQVAVGVAMIMTGFGASVGMGLITEGIADYATALRAVYTRHFTWNDYCKQKAISLIISSTTMGWQAIKDAGKGMKNITVGLTEEILEQAGTEIVVNGKTVAKTLQEASQQLKSLAWTQVGVTAGETATRETLNYVADSLSHLCFEKYKPRIVASICEKIDVKFAHTSLSHLIAKWHAVDQIRGKNVFGARIDFTIRSTLNPENSFWRQQWDAVGLPLVKGILSAPQYLGSNFSTGARVYALLNGAEKIITAVDSFHEQLLDSLRLIDQESLSITTLLVSDCEIPEADAVKITSVLKREGVLLDDYCIDSSKLHAVDFGEYRAYRTKVIDFLSKLATQMESFDLTETKNKISEIMANHVIATAESQLVAPITSYAVATGVNAFSTTLQDMYFRNKAEKDKQTLESAIKDINDKIAVATDDEKGALQNTLFSMQADYSEITELLAKEVWDEKKKKYIAKPPISISNAMMIGHHSEKYVTAHSQCSIVVLAKQKEEKASRSDKTDQYASEVRRDKPADVLDMKKMAADNGVNLKVVDEHYSLTSEDREKGVKIAIFVKGKPDRKGHVGIGHWKLMDVDGKAMTVESEGYDCGYAVMGVLTGKSIKQLREETAESIQHSGGSFSKAIEVRDWLVSNNPRTANDVLFNGGKKRKKQKKEKIQLDPSKPTTDIYFISEPLDAWKSAHKHNGSLRHIAIIVNDPVKGLVRIELDRHGSRNDYLITPIDQAMQTNLFSNLNDKGVILHKIGEINDFSLEQVENWARECVDKYPTYGPGDYWWANLIYGKNKNCRGFVDYVAFRLFKYNPAKFADGINIDRFYDQDRGPVREFEHRIEKDGWSNVQYNSPIVPKRIEQEEETLNYTSVPTTHNSSSSSLVPPSMSSASSSSSPSSGYSQLPQQSFFAVNPSPHLTLTEKDLDQGAIQCLVPPSMSSTSSSSSFSSGYSQLPQQSFFAVNPPPHLTLIEKDLDQEAIQCRDTCNC